MKKKKDKNIVLIDLNVKAFVQSYLATAAWATCENDECQEFTRKAQQHAKTDCIEFIIAVENRFGREKANQLLTIPGSDLTYLAPHDFFLTRNHHGAGFFDQAEKFGKEEIKILEEICHDIGETDCYHIRGKKSKLMFD